MIFACQYCGGIEAFIIAVVVAAWGWGCYMLARVFAHVRKRLRPVKPECQSCNWFISCSMAQVTKCPRQKPWYYRLWRKP